MRPVSDDRSFRAKLDAAGGRPSGFDYMRLILSVAVYISHAAATSYGEAGAKLLWDSPAGPLVRAILPMFFALSGILVAGSMERCATLVKFMGLRAIRIYPALAVEVLLSALVVGPLVTTVSLGAYFTDPLFWRYMVNVTGHISFLLPGVFADNPAPDYVNRQLWTVPYELECYIALGVLIVLGAKRHRSLLLVGTAVAIAYKPLIEFYRRGFMTQNAEAFDGPLLVAIFLVGVTLHAYREHLVLDKWVALFASVFGLVAIGFLPGGYYFALVPIAYVTVFLGTLNPRRIGVVRSADYSYGIFLYGYVVQQTLMAVVPWSREWYWNIAIGLPLTIMVAALSWHWVEKPATRLKERVSRLETWWLATRAKHSARFAG